MAAKTLADLMGADRSAQRLTGQVQRLQWLRAPRAVREPAEKQLESRRKTLTDLFNAGEEKRVAREAKAAETLQRRTLREGNATAKASMASQKVAFYTDETGKVRPITGPGGKPL